MSISYFFKVETCLNSKDVQMTKFPDLHRICYICFLKGQSCKIFFILFFSSNSSFCSYKRCLRAVLNFSKFSQSYSTLKTSWLHGSLETKESHFCKSQKTPRFPKYWGVAVPWYQGDMTPHYFGHQGVATSHFQSTGESLYFSGDFWWIKNFALVSICRPSIWSF